MTQDASLNVFRNQGSATLSSQETSEVAEATGSIGNVVPRLGAGPITSMQHSLLQKRTIPVELLTEEGAFGDLSPGTVVHAGGIAKALMNLSASGTLDSPYCVFNAGGFASLKERIRASLSAVMLEPALDASLRRTAYDRPPDITIILAHRLLAAAHDLRMNADIVAVTRSQGVAVTFASERRYAIFECDSDGDLVLIMTDRTQDAEAETRVINPGQEVAALEKASRFLQG